VVVEQQTATTAAPQSPFPVYEAFCRLLDDPWRAWGYNLGMVRWLAVAALGALLIATPLWGQRRSGGVAGFGGHAGFASHGAFAGRGGIAVSRGGFSGSVRGPRFGGGFGQPFFHHPHFVTRRPYFGYGGYYGYPYYGYPSYYDDNGYYPSYNSAEDGGYAPGRGDQQQQQAEIDRLENEVDRLRQERSSPARSQAPSKTDLHSMTELVFHDHHTQEVQNYAIVGQTFWIFDSQQTKKVPLSELDVPATIKANDARGVDFQVPR